MILSWNGKREHVDTHNCFMYALNILNRNKSTSVSPQRTVISRFTQPGLVAGFLDLILRDQRACPEMIARILGDNPSIKQSGWRGNVQQERPR
jgi:hypothetical protein